MPNHNLLLVNNDKSSNDIIDSNQEKIFYLQINNNNNNNSKNINNNNTNTGCLENSVSKKNNCSSNGTKKIINRSIDEYLNLINCNESKKSLSRSSNGSLHDSASDNISYCKSNSATGLALLNKPVKVLICTESFHPYTSGIARRFKEIIERLSKRGFLIHIVTGCKVNTTL